ncbi:F-box only protein 5 [Genypterus blacodes]|uniref:F-box only protein 5 n=1 Tax=Genypterus blacodes TaxID=154954 RepID=UPI003F75EA88
MKCKSYDAARGHNMEKIPPAPIAGAPAEGKLLYPQVSPLKQPPTIKPLFPAACVSTPPCYLNRNTRAAHNKENSNRLEHERSLDFEDSGYLSLQSSPACHQRVDATPGHSPSKSVGRTQANRPAILGSTSTTPVSRPEGRAVKYSLSSTPASQHHEEINHHELNLPVLNFQRAVCEELAKGYQRTKRYDWSVVTKLADDYTLDRVIGRKMGLEHVDVFSSLLSRNMRGILAQILALLGDLDLISCKKVSRTWRKIICEDKAALSRCQQAEQALRESGSSQARNRLSLTRDVAVSRVILSCMQTLASPTSSSSSSPSSPSSTPACRIASQKKKALNSQNSRFNEYVEAASHLKQHESLCPCKRCGSPATHSVEAQRATCTRASCHFDFCTLCRESFHGSSPCRVVHAHFRTSKTTPILPGTARSKRNVRRL